MAAAVGYIELVKKHLDADPATIRMAVDDKWFPMKNPHAGGSIYIWTLGKFRTAHQVAARFGHRDVVVLLMERSPTEVKLANAFVTGDAAFVKMLFATHRDLVKALAESDPGQIIRAAEDNNTGAVRLMLDCGWSPDGGITSVGRTPLHWAAWQANREMADLLVRHKAKLDIHDPDFHAMPLGWAIHASLQGPWRDRDYAAIVDLLLAAGVPPPAEAAGSASVREVIARYIK